MSKHHITLTCTDSDDDAAADHMSFALDVLLLILNRDTDFGKLDPWHLDYGYDQFADDPQDEQIVLSKQEQLQMGCFVSEYGRDEEYDEYVPTEEDLKGDR